MNCICSTAQTGTPQQVLTKIYKAYDSLKYLSFNVKYTYTSDTVREDFINDVLEGTYTLAGKKARFNLDNIEFMQNDSFFIAVYNEDKFIMVSDPRSKNAGSELPMRQVMDSLVTMLGHYTLGLTNFSDTAVVKLTKIDSIAKFTSFTLTFDTAQNIIHSISYAFEELTPVDSMGITLPPVMRQKRLKIEFSNYRFDNFSDLLYDENNYIFFENGVCKPVEKYNDFRIFYSRIGNTNITQQSGAN
jgi:hypothetical protein